MVPISIDVAPDGTLYIADDSNQTIRRVTLDGQISLFAGGGTVSGTAANGGRATAAKFISLVKLRVALDGSLLAMERITSAPNSVAWVRRIGTDGILRLFAGSGAFGQNGNGGPAASATVEQPWGLAVTPDGSVLIGDAHQVRLVTPDGTIHMAAGTAGFGFAGDNGPATAAMLADGSLSVAAAPDGTFYIAEGQTKHVRSVTFAPIIFASADGSEKYVIDAAGRHQKTIDPITGATLYNFHYTNGLLTSIDDFNGGTTSIQRDANGNLQSINPPQAQPTTFTPDSPGPNAYMASATDPASRTSHFTYGVDGVGLLATMTEPNGGSPHRFGYDPATGRLISDQDPAGGTKILGQSYGAGSFYVQIATGMGVQTNYATYLGADAGTPNAIVSRVNTMPDGTRNALVFGSDHVTAVQFGDGTQIVKSELPDPRFGMLAPLPSASMTVPAVPGAQAITMTVADTRFFGAADGGQSGIVYDGGVFLFTEQQNVNGNTWSSTFDPSTFARTNISPVGRTSTTLEDDAGRPVQIQPSGITPTQLTYDGHGRLQTITQGTFVPGPPDSGAAPVPRTWTLSYDTSGFLSGMTDPMDASVTYSNDLVGQARDTFLPESDGGARDLNAGFDSNGNLQTVTLPRNAPLEAHGLLYTPTNQLREYDPPAAGAGTWSTTDQYDFDERLKLETRPDTTTIVPDYDSAGRLFHITYPQGVITRSYNPPGAVGAGYLASIAMPNGETVGYSYQGPLVRGITWSTNSPVHGSATFAYDSTFRMSQLQIGGLAAVSFQYDNDDLLTVAGVENPIKRDSGNGRITDTTVASILDHYDYDGNGLLADYSVRVNQGNPFYSEQIVARDGDERITERVETALDVNNNTVRHDWIYKYDLPGRLTDVTEDGAPTVHYDYDADDNRVGVSSGGVNTQPVYDAQDRLTSYPAAGATFTYGQNGELATKAIGSQTTSYTYDVFGNLLHAGFSTALSDGVSSVDYIVDGENRRVGRIAHANGTSVQTGFLYKDSLHPVAELNGSNVVVAQFVYGSRTNVPDYMTTPSPAATYRILSDHLGSPRMVVDASSGNVVETMTYDEFGNETEALAANKPAGYVPLPFGFAGGLYDPDTKFVRFGARDYDASVGRWTAKDPSLFDGGHNLYEYSWNDPTNYIDQTGTYCFFITIGVGAAEGAAWGAGIELLSQELSGRTCIDWSAVGKAALGGAVQGAVLGSFGLLGGAWCFSPGTLVATCDSGEQPIETLREHDRVLSQNEDGTIGCHEVSRTFERVADDRVDVAVGSGETQETLHTTLGHRFWVERRGWVAAKDLQTDDVALDMGGSEQPITQVSTEPGFGRVYNLEVQEAHTYFVGETKVLVHNGCVNTVPPRLARVIPAEFARGSSLAAPGATEAWVTAAEDLSGITTSEGLASRLTLVDQEGNLIPGARAVIEFDTPAEGLASPILRSNPGFVGGGFTAGGAREFVLPNLGISELANATVRIVP
jgi:RHS repeat-associated protein